MYNITQSQISQDILIDRSSSGRERPWAQHKQANMQLADIYRADINERKADRLEQCATHLGFAVLPDGGKRLVEMHSCRVRLCPICGWRRSLKIGASMHDILTCARVCGYKWLLLTLTVRNVPGEQLDKTLDDIMSAWHRMTTRRKMWRDTVKGWYRGLEVTHNINKHSPSYDTYHPHLHCVLAVDGTYNKQSRGYITQRDWTSLWQDALRADYTPIVDIRTISGDPRQIVPEVAKYAVKSSDYIQPTDWELSRDTVQILDRALDNRRLVAWGGALKEWHKRLGLDDEMDGDLISIDGEQVNADGEILDVMRYIWRTGYNQYVKE